jgi:hypothetical protein
VVKLLLPASLLLGARLMCLFSSLLVVDSTAFVVLVFFFL